VLAVPGLIGARLLFVASNWALYRREPKRIWRRSDSGGAMQGGFVLAVATSPAVLAVIGLPFGAFWDVATFAMLVWLIIGKLGCALHGCCSGRPSVGPISLPLRDSHGIKCRRIPSQFLEAGFAVVLLVGAAALWHGAPFPGALFLSTGVAYGTGRFFLQPLRHEHIHAGNVDIQRAVSAALTVVSLAALLVLSLAPDSGS
jgi:phosphatidylglycerol---prolipoprotein diacylglyceryl transferase